MKGDIIYHNAIVFDGEIEFRGEVIFNKPVIFNKAIYLPNPEAFSMLKLGEETPVMEKKVKKSSAKRDRRF